MPTSLLFLSVAGSHWLGLLPMTEGRRAGDRPDETLDKGGHQPDRGGPLTGHVLHSCRFPVVAHSITLSQPARRQSTALAFW